MAADTGMDTCPSPEITDSRKRPLDGDSENGDVKRSHFSSGKSGIAPRAAPRALLSTLFYFIAYLASKYNTDTVVTILRIASDKILIRAHRCYQRDLFRRVPGPLATQQLVVSLETRKAR